MSNFIPKKNPYLSILYFFYIADTLFYLFVTDFELPSLCDALLLNKMYGCTVHFTSAGKLNIHILILLTCIVQFVLL